MSRQSLTGSESKRQIEILNRWLSFEPISNEDYAISGVLYSVPLGQHFSPDVRLNSGSYTSISGTIQIEKDIHQFEREEDASIFITENGPENIILVQNKNIYNRDIIEVHLVNQKNIDIFMEIDNLDERNGYRIEVLRTGSFGLEEIPRKIKKDKRGRIISDTYLKYFDVEVDK